MKPVASTRHTVILLGIFAAIAALGALNAAKAAGPALNRVPFYLAALVSEWMLFRYTLVGLVRAGTPIGEIFGDRLRSRKAWAFALFGGVLAWASIGFLGEGVKLLLGAVGMPVHADDARTLAAVRPHGALESALWILVSISAGICEEFVFRGYMLRQFSAWFGGRGRGLLASSIVFGLGHAYQGLAPVLVITAIGLGFGTVALLTRRLGPGIVGHALMDGVSGLLGR